MSPPPASVPARPPGPVPARPPGPVPARPPGPVPALAPDPVPSFWEPEPDLAEGPMLIGWLETFRGALRRKCAGLTPDQLRAAPVAPSNLSLLGLVRHLTEMERVHLVHAIAGTPVVFVYYSEADPEADFQGAGAADATETFRRWAAEQVRADEILAPYRSGSPLPAPVRFRLVKVIGEYARHAGHADLIRESLDGVTGE
jgi:Protein of unknown function (DUF664)